MTRRDSTGAQCHTLLVRVVDFGVRNRREEVNWSGIVAMVGHDVIVDRVKYGTAGSVFLVS